MNTRLNRREGRVDPNAPNVESTWQWKDVMWMYSNVLFYIYFTRRLQPNHSLMLSVRPSFVFNCFEDEQWWRSSCSWILYFLRRVFLRLQTLGAAADSSKAPLHRWHSNYLCINHWNLLTFGVFYSFIDYPYAAVRSRWWFFFFSPSCVKPLRRCVSLYHTTSNMWRR